MLSDTSLSTSGMRRRRRRRCGYRVGDCISSNASRTDSVLISIDRRKNDVVTAGRNSICNRRRIHRYTTTIIAVWSWTTIVLTLCSGTLQIIVPPVVEGSPRARTTKTSTKTTTTTTTTTTARSSVSTMNPFNKERTGVSGFGARSIKKTIFPPTTIPTPPEVESVEEIEDVEDDDGDQSDESAMTEDDKIAISSPRHALTLGTDDDDEYGHTEEREVQGGGPYGDVVQDYTDSDDHEEDLQHEALLSTADASSSQLWVQRTKDPDILWVQIRERADGHNNDVGGGGKPRTLSTLKLSVSKDTGDWQVERRTALGFLDGEWQAEDRWVPIEGFYGLYRVPSGVLWVLVSKTEPVYTAPLLKGSNDSWWQIRRVSNFEIVHLSRPKSSLSALELREEVRQLKLLRKSLKHHDFYYIPATTGESSVIQDMTKTLQRSIQEYTQCHDGDSHTPSCSWWKKPDNDNQSERPDPRFFWNQLAVEPISHRYSRSKRNEPRQLADTLLQHVLPLTSAFVGIQANVTVDERGNGQKQKKKDGTSVPSITYDEIVISRRSRFRAGTRFAVRGADTTGAVANFVETEQICLMAIQDDADGDGDGGGDATRHLQSVASHVQVRGSIPLRWSSPADVKTYRPKVRIGTDPLAQARAVRLHLLDQLSQYATTEKEATRTRNPTVADVVFVNLIDKKSDQGRLGKAFDAVLQAVVDVYGTEDDVTSAESDGSQENDIDASSRSTSSLGPRSVEHVWFDFHAEVKNGRWDRLSNLLDKLQPSLESHGYFLAHPSQEGDSINWSIKRRQNAVVRTNCMDCLDRTNVVQSIFGRYVLYQQLSDMVTDLFAESEDTSVSKRWMRLKRLYSRNRMALPWTNGEVSHRLLWADNADAISRLYAGTDALKGDFTRTGKRTKMGALDDGMNSLQRYYLNNFLDADRQEGYDLMVGRTSFSNLDHSIDLHNSTEALMTRVNLLCEAQEGSDDHQRMDFQSRLTEIGALPSETTSLDLRWIPGDLQTQLRSQASEPVRGSNGRLASEGTMNARGFDSRKAMEAIDLRSNMQMPWWAVAVDDDWLGLDDQEDDNETNGSKRNSKDVMLGVQQMRLAITSPLPLAALFVLGIRAPLILAAIPLAILSLVYLPGCIKNDFTQTTSSVK